MNCKPGDLAVIVSCIPNWSEHVLGRIITVKKLTSNRKGQPSWYYEPPLISKSGDEFAIVEDWLLRPLRDPGEDAKDNAWDWLPPVPSKEHA